MIKKFLKRGMAVTLAMSLVTGLAPVGICPGRSSVKEAKAATLKYQCNSCDQKFSSKVSSHNHIVTCDGTMSKHGKACGGELKHEVSKCDCLISGTTGSTKGSDGLYHSDTVVCGNGHYRQIVSPIPNDHWEGTCSYTYYDRYECDKCGRWCDADEVVEFLDKYYCNKCSNWSYSPGPCDRSRTESCSGSLSALKATLTFNSKSNGGSSSNFTRNPYYDSVYSYTTSDTASKDGWEFVGWNTNGNAKEKQSSVKVDDDKTVYAIFKKDVKVSFIDR